MNAMSLRNFQKAQVLTAVSRRRYCLTELASSFHQHVWIARSERSEYLCRTSASLCTILIKTSDGTQVIIKTPLRGQDDEQRKAIRQLDAEMMILNNPLKNAGGIRQLIDQIIIKTGLGEETRAGVFEYLDVDLHKLHLTQKCQLSRLEIKSIARQVLKALCVTHRHNIVHTGYFE